MAKDMALMGSTFGRWTIVGEASTTDRGEKQWLARCACGTQRYVLERSLKSGGSLSCGCLRIQKANDARTRDLQGQTFGELLVLGRTEGTRHGDGIKWLCRCSCGRECEVAATLLVCGRKTRCGQCRVKQYYKKDITGKRFDRLTALYPKLERDAKGNVIWHCRCDCGNEVDFSYNVLMYSDLKSCGCRKREHNQEVCRYLTHVDGTSLDLLRSTKIPSNNTTGVKGVYLIRGKYVAKMVFQKKQYFLGTYDSIERAAQARWEAEEAVNQTVVTYYAKWKQRADADPEWAQENPVRIIVDRDAAGGLKLLFRPEMKA